MARYIDAELLTEELVQILFSIRPTNKWAHGKVNECLVKVKHAPTADVAPVLHARWIGIGWRRDAVSCSACDKMFVGAAVEWADRNCLYCPNCGAKMDEEKTK